MAARRAEDRDADRVRRELRRALPSAPASTCCSSATRSAWSIQGHASTLPVTLDDVLYHTRCVAAGARARARDRRPAVRQLSGERRRRRTPRAAAALKAGAQMVKLEGGAWLAPTVEFLDRARRPGLRPRRPAAAVGQRARRLSRAGQDAGRRRSAAGRRRARWPPRRRDAGRRMRAARARRGADARGRHSGHRHRRRTRRARGRCW